MGRNARQGAGLAIALIAATAIWLSGRCGDSAEREVKGDAAPPARGTSSWRQTPALPATRQGEAATPARASHSRFAALDGGAADKATPPPAELRALLRSSLEEALARRDPPVRLSDDDLDELTDSALRIKRARQRLREIPREQGAGPDLGRARRDMEAATRRFEAIAGVDLVELTADGTPSRSAGGEDPVLETAGEAAERARDGGGGGAPPPRVRDAGAQP